MVKKLGKIGLVAVLFMLNVSFIKAEECDNFNYILLDSKTMEECGSVEDFEFSDDSLAFSCNGKEYEFDLEKVESKDEAECYSGNNGDVFCNMAEEEGNIGIQVINKDIYPEDRTVQNGNFTIIATNVDKEEIVKAIEDNEELKIIEENNKENIIDSQVQALGSASNGVAHVLASGDKLPGFMKSGTSEGWATYASVEPGYYMVSKISYSVSKFYGSDGISLWYKRDANTHLFRTPTDCPAGLKSVSGAWKVKHGSSTLMAETTAKVSVKGVPVIKTVRDCYYF